MQQQQQRAGNLIRYDLYFIKNRQPTQLNVGNQISQTPLVFVHA